MTEPAFTALASAACLAAGLVLVAGLVGSLMRTGLGPDETPLETKLTHPTFLIPNATGDHHAQRRRYRIDRIGPVDRRRSTHPSY